MIAEATALVMRTPIKSMQSGCEAKFVPLWDGWGFKFYRGERTRDKTYDMQKKASEAGAAPKVGEKTEFTMEVENWDGELRPTNFYGYLTETVKVIKVMFCEQFNIHYDDAYDHPDHEDFWQEYSDRPEFVELKDKLRLIGFDMQDYHWGNVGYDSKGNAVCIDFDEIVYY